MNTKKVEAKLFASWVSNNHFYSEDSISDGQVLKKEAEKRLVELFHEAAKKVPAYKDFLKKNKVNPEKIKNVNELKAVPPTSKENYITYYDTKQRCWNGSLDGMNMISTSSGTTGHPHFWPRNLRSEIEGAYAHEWIFREVFNIDKKNTLLINGFAMGNWIAGTFTLACANLLTWKGYKLTTMTPGYSAEGILDILDRVSPKYEQTLITGHTPFLKEVVELAAEKKVDFKGLNVKLLGTGQGITEKWREYVIKLLQTDDYYHTMINLYGSADAALMGFETPVSIEVRKKINDNPELKKEIFVDERLPSIYQFDPRLTYFESLNGELLISKYSGCPLIRYNLLDEGGVLEFDSLLSKARLNTKETNQKMPFVYLYGRDKFMVKIFGANIYSEHVQQALSHEKIQSLLSGRFHLETIYDEKNDPKWVCHLELNKGLVEAAETAALVESVLIDEIKKINTEYHFVLSKLGDKVKPIIKLYNHGHPTYFPDGKIVKNS